MENSALSGSQHPGFYPSPTCNQVGRINLALQVPGGLKWPKQQFAVKS